MRTRGWRGAETGRRIREQYADTGGFTDHVFAACSILGYAFASSPRTRARTSWRPADEAETRAAHTEPDAETRERLSLRSRSRVGSFLTVAMRGREVSGPEAEYRAALEIPDGIPLDLWEADRPVESRQDAAPPAPAAGTGVNLRPVLPYVFTPSLAGDLMVDMPSAQSGAYSEMVITSPLTAGPREKGTARASTGATLTAATTTPRSITARLNLTAEDVAAVGTDSFEAALRQNLSMALSDQLDEQLVNGDAAGQNLAGFLNQLADPDALGAVATWLTDPVEVDDPPSFDDDGAVVAEAVAANACAHLIDSTRIQTLLTFDEVIGLLGPAVFGLEPEPVPPPAPAPAPAP